MISSSSSRLRISPTSPLFPSLSYFPRRSNVQMWLRVWFFSALHPSSAGTVNFSHDGSKTEPWVVTSSLVSSVSRCFGRISLPTESPGASPSCQRKKQGTPLFTSTILTGGAVVSAASSQQVGRRFGSCPGTFLWSLHVLPVSPNSDVQCWRSVFKSWLETSSFNRMHWHTLGILMQLCVHCQALNSVVKIIVCQFSCVYYLVTSRCMFCKVHCVLHCDQQAMSILFIEMKI